MTLIVGLGNPGREYAGNRHNVGFRCLDYFARKQGIAFRKCEARSLLGMGDVMKEKIILAKPLTFMNRSGESVAALLRRHRLSPADLLVIYDDLDLPLGKLRIRERGGAGGHNGIKSIINHLGSDEFARIRIGIAPQEEVETRYTRTPEYVLSDFDAEERIMLKETYIRVSDAVNCLVTEGTTAAMNKYNNSG